MARLLVVEDDETIGGVLNTSLLAHGHDVTWVRTGQGALREAAAHDLDLVLLDLGLPDLDGVEVCRRLRTQQPGAVLVVLTARTDEMDVVVGLEAGADDYLTKPLRLDELRARIRAHLRRGGPVAPAGAGTVELGSVFIDVAGRRVTVAGTEISLRAKEFDLLARLAADAGSAVSRETLMCDVWDVNWFGSTKTLDMHIAALRRRLGGTGATGLPEIVTLRGHGYRLDPPH
ncbi:response regulator transcription factor [Pseudonocardia abyssalis]|jgi:DNA-binding response OmpR family regulator|uniref:Response regulator transcription factor n=1 Tax=Pseudonocardia abyssalis TaxID=2792008 RepID=A0ABS6V1S6_9PSEU|nr:response regulator transcription factor [Pseudonocardia abyssalis]MBW0115143.1 response regulator transcription factor [Pseudonocardia abyssalis]MBW0138451.1 response regulator transcription factor [Pseudonocardia abyssalis]